MKQASFGRDGHGGPGWRCWRVWQSWCAVFIAQARGESDDVLAVTRNFYGVLRVRRMRRSFEENGRKVEEPFRMLMHGGSGHGGEYESPKLRRTTVDCYSPNTAVAKPQATGSPQTSTRGSDRARRGDVDRFRRARRRISVV